MPEATALEIGEHSVLYLTMTDASSVVSALFSVRKTVLTRTRTATSKLTFIIVKDVAFVLVSAGHRR